MSPLRNQKGQGVVELVLLMAVTVSISLAVSKYLRDNQAVQNLVGKPWNTLSGMIECGVWSGCGSGKHPNSINRSLSYKPTD